MANGKQTWSDIAHRIGIWGAVVVMAAKLFTMGAWVGAAEEKFKDAATVEETQKALLLQVNTLAAEAKATTKAVESNTAAIANSEKAVLAAIESLKD